MGHRHGDSNPGLETKDTRIGTDLPVERTDRTGQRTNGTGSHGTCQSRLSTYSTQLHTRDTHAPARHRSGYEPSTRALDRMRDILLQLHAVFCQLRKNKVTLCLYGEETVRDGERR